MKRTPSQLFPLFLSSGAVALVLLLQEIPYISKASPSRAGLLQRLEWITYDWRVRQAAGNNSVSATNLGWVEISDESIRAINDGSLGFSYGLYWPRAVYGRMLRELTAEGARAVSFDVLFSEEREDHKNILVELPDHRKISSDDFFAEEIGHAGNVILAAVPDLFPAGSFQRRSKAVGDILNDGDADGILRRARPFRDVDPKWNPIILHLAKAVDLNLGQARIDRTARQILIPYANGTNLFSLELNPDGSLNTAELGLPAGPRQWPQLTRLWHLGIVLAAAELRLDLEHPVIETNRLILNGPNGIRRIIPLERDGTFFINWSLPPGDPRVFTEGIEGVIARDRQRYGTPPDPPTTNFWRNKLVVVGSRATGNGLTDLGPTPLGKQTFLVSKYWNIANSIIVDRFVRSCPNSLAMLIIIALGAVSGFLTWRMGGLWGAACLLSLVGAYVLVADLVFIRNRIWLPLVLPIAGSCGLNYVCLTSYRVLFEQKEKRRVKGVFSKIVSPDVVNELLSAESLALGGARRRVTVFFADVRGFTEFTDTMQANAEEHVRRYEISGTAAESYFEAQATEALNTVNLYLSIIAETVKKHLGTLDKYIGDCVMAFWGAPIANPQHATACVRAAVEAQRAIYRTNQERFAENEKRKQANELRADKNQPPAPLLPMLSVGSGINTGIVTVGLMGSDAHILNYTVFGREVNLASRVEGICERGQVLITEATLLDLQRDDPELAASCVAKPPVKVKGIRQAVKIFEVPWKTTIPAAAEKPAAPPMKTAGIGV